ncbi:unnamed protein product [Phyllotreta striolata]|uniref:Cationic amino acid transporter C-terminal domain-containing protein n=1 Tax=Phyllotreta striolata TaxID=444603 RepID=A0A9N9U1L1_PHYSR|nr:unnamed protein product [Phyllotreta striolata]
MERIWKVLTRKKVIDPVGAEDTQLARRLNTFDLTALGVGSTLGVGVYVLAGQVATIAGPSVVLSFLIAAVASVFAGLCYAEFGARAPRAGSAYIYSYVCVGEFIAFIIGWNLILEYIIGSASVAKGLSLYLDNLLNNTLQDTFRQIAPINVPYMAEYFDFFSCGISIVLAIALAFGLKESSLANNIFTTLNIGVVLFVIIAGSIKADPANWNYKPDGTKNETVVGKGGFFPFGIEGTIKGAATCFYGFVGFDCIATTAEEVLNPKKAIPISIVLSLLIIFLAYFGISTVVTLMVPYFLQDFNAPIPYAFEHIGWNWAKWIVSIGGIFGLFASLFGAMFPLPRIIYAMATDGLVFKFLGRISSRFHTPVIGTLLAGTLTGLMAALFELTQLVKMMSIGTLMAYTIVAASVLLLRYSMDEETIVYIPVRNLSDSEDSDSYTDDIASFTAVNNTDNPNEENELLSYEQSGNRSIMGQIFNCGRHSEPTKRSQSIVTVEVFLYCFTCVLIGLSAIFLKHPIANGETWAIVLASFFIFTAAVLLMSIATQPVSRRELHFKVPMVPLIPALSILANIYLMLMLDFHTWVRFAVWMIVGLPIYYFSLKPIEEARARLVDKPDGNSANGAIPNEYYDNDGFVDDPETLPKKKKRAPQPPPIDDKPEVIEIEQELQKFDEMLEEVERDDRKSSIGSVSVCDVPCKENVVADVHCDNVVTPAIPASPAPLFACQVDQIEPNDIQNEGDHLDADNITQQEEDIVILTPEHKPINPFSSLRRPLSFTSISDPDHKIIEAISNGIMPTPTPPPSPDLTREETSIPVPPPLPPPSEVIAPTKIKKNTRETLPRVTSNKIKEVTLRPTRQQPKQEEVGFEPGNDNIKISSLSSKSFLKNLNSKLTRLNLQPNYIAPVIQLERGSAPSTLKYEKNENVIEDSINKDDAKEKLELFVDSRLSLAEPAKKAPSENSRIAYPDPLETNGTSDGNLENGVDRLGNNEGEDYLAHQIRMKNVFRSMKSVDQSKEKPKESRIVKSLHLARDDDALNHRQAMSEIFKSIEIRRKDSAQQSS